MAAFKSAAMVVGLSIVALSQATAPQFYIPVAMAGDTKRATVPVVISPPLTLTKVNGIAYLGIDPGVFGMIVQLDGKTIGTRGTLNLVSGPDIALTAIDSPAGITVQVSVSGGCTFDANRNSVCPGSGTDQTPVVIPANSPVKP